MNDNYTGQTAIFAGMSAPSAFPAWRRNLAQYEWAAIPQSNSIQSIDPAQNPAINPNFPNAAPWRAVGGIAGVTNAWCGACYDDTTGTYMIPLSGGHADYAGNEPYSVNLLADTVQWRMLRNPSGAVGNLMNLNDGLESTGVYADGRLRAIHSYNVHTSGNGRFFITALPAIAFSGQAQVRKVFEISPVTGESVEIADYTSVNMGNMLDATAIYDTLRDKIVLTHATGGTFLQIDPDTGATESFLVAANKFNAGSNAVYAENLDRYIYLATQTTNTAFAAHRGLAVVNPATRQIVYPQCQDFPAGINKQAGLVWQASQNRLLAWNNSSDTRRVTTITPSNPSDLSQPWTVGFIDGTGATPTSRVSTGTYNRMQYVKRLGGFVLLNSVGDQMYFMRID